MTKLAIATNQPSTQDVKRYQLAAEKLGLAHSVVSPFSRTAAEEMSVASHLLVRLSAKTYGAFEAVSPLLSDDHLNTVLRSLRAFDKIASASILTNSAIPFPASRRVTVKDIHEEHNFPYVLKVPRGNRGLGVHLITNHRDAVATATNYPEDYPLLLQEYIRESAGQDKRLFVVGGEVVASMMRRSKGSDFRANVSLGGSAKAYAPTKDEVSIALEAVRLHGLDYAGVDIIDSSRGPLVLEINPSPGLKIEMVTGREIADKVIKEILRGNND